MDFCNIFIKYHSQPDVNFQQTLLAVQGGKSSHVSLPTAPKKTVLATPIPLTFPISLALRDVQPTTSTAVINSSSRSITAVIIVPSAKYPQSVDTSARVPASTQLRISSRNLSLQRKAPIPSPSSTALIPYHCGSARLKIPRVVEADEYPARKMAINENGLEFIRVVKSNRERC